MLLDTRLYNLMIRQKNLRRTFHRAPSAFRSSNFAGTPPSEKLNTNRKRVHGRAAERGENRVHSRSVLKFQEAEVLVIKLLSFFLYSNFLRRYVDFLQEIHFCRQVDLPIPPFLALIP